MARRRDTSRFDALAKCIEGEVISRGARSFAATLNALTWNSLKPNRSPDAIVRPTSAQDVCRTIRFARERGLKIAVRGSGHNYQAAPIRDDGLLLDLSRLDRLEIDAAKRCASVQPAITGSRLVAALTPLELAFPVGHCPDVALSGFLLSGGIGWNAGQWGPACMSVRGVEIVVATGELIYADEQRHPELLWAARGAGPGFFGVITRYDIELEQAPHKIEVSSIAFDVSCVDSIGNWLDDLAQSAPPQVELVCTLGAAQDPLSPTKATALSLTAVAFTDCDGAGQEWLSRLEGHPRDAQVLGRARHDIASFDGLLEEPDPPKSVHRMAGDVYWSDSSTRALLDRVREGASSVSSQHSYVLLQPRLVRPTGSTAFVPAAFSMWGAVFVGIYSLWEDPAQDETCRCWVQSLADAVEPLKVGHYVGEADLTAGPERPSQCFSAAAWRRLAALKQQYDPEDLFHSYLDH